MIAHAPHPLAAMQYLVWSPRDAVYVPHDVFAEAVEYWSERMEHDDSHVLEARINAPLIDVTDLARAAYEITCDELPYWLEESPAQRGYDDAREARWVAE